MDDTLDPYQHGGHSLVGAAEPDGATDQSRLNPDERKEVWLHSVAL